jgi:FkbM family methyltransferase
MILFWKFIRRMGDSFSFRARRHLRASALRGTSAESLGANADTHELLALLVGNPPAVIYDIGGHHGRWTLLAKAHFPRADIHAFEPLPAHGDVFLENTRGLDNVTLHRIGLSNHPGDRTMEVPLQSDSASLLVPAADLEIIYGVKKGSRTTVPVTTLDQWRESGNHPAPELIKLDIQGGELDALVGAENCLISAQAVLIEVSFRTFYQGQPGAGELFSHLESRGFRLRAQGETLYPGPMAEQLDMLFTRTASK